MFPGAIVRGAVTISWLEGEKFLIWRARTDRQDAEGSSNLTMHYFDSRGVYRTYRASIDGDALELAREEGFPQRMRYTISSDGRTIDGKTQLRHEDAWQDDLMITSHRR